MELNYSEIRPKTLPDWSKPIPNHRNLHVLPTTTPRIKPTMVQRAKAFRAKSKELQAHPDEGGFFVQAFTAIIEDETLTSLEKRVYLILKAKAMRGCLVKASRASIGEMMGKSEKTVSRAISGLNKRGLVEYKVGRIYQVNNHPKTESTNFKHTRLPYSILYNPNITSTDLVVLLRLLSNRQGRSHAEIRQSTIAKTSGVKLRTVKRAYRFLRAAGLIEVKVKVKEGVRKYHFCREVYTKLPELQLKSKRKKRDTGDTTKEAKKGQNGTLVTPHVLENEDKTFIRDATEVSVALPDSEQLQNQPKGSEVEMTWKEETGELMNLTTRRTDEAKGKKKIRGIAKTKVMTAILHDHPFDEPPRIKHNERVDNLLDLPVKETKIKMGDVVERYRAAYRRITGGVASNLTPKERGQLRVMMNERNALECVNMIEWVENNWGELAEEHKFTTFGTGILVGFRRHFWALMQKQEVKNANAEKLEYTLGEPFGAEFDVPEITYMAGDERHSVVFDVPDVAPDAKPEAVFMVPEVPWQEGDDKHSAEFFLD